MLVLVNVVHVRESEREQEEVSLQLVQHYNCTPSTRETAELKQRRMPGAVRTQLHSIPTRPQRSQHVTQLPALSGPCDSTACHA